MGRLKLICIFILPMMFLSGCWDSKDPEDRAYIITMGVDKGEDGYIFSFAPAKTQQKDPELLVANGATIASAMVDMDTQNSRKTDLGQLKMVVLGKSALEDKVLVDSILDELERSQEVSEKIMLLGTEGTAEECLKAVMKEDSGTGLFLWDFYHNTATDVAITKGLDLDSFLAEMSEQKGAIVLPAIQVKEEKISIGGGVALVDEVYQFSFSEKEEEGYLLLIGEGEGAIIEAKVKEGSKIPLKVVKNTVEYKISEKEDGSILCIIESKVSADLLGTPKDNVFDPKKKKELENLFEGIIKTELENTIRIAQENQGEEILGIGAKVRRKFPEISQEFWDTMEIKVVPKVRIRNTGKIR